MNCNTCEQCGKQFEPSRHHPNQRFCTTKCSNTWWYQNGNHEYTCQHCGKTYTAKHVSRNQYCSRECAFEAKQARAQTRGIAPVFVKVCPVCGEYVEGRNVYCGDECRKEVARIKAREYAAQQHEGKRCKCKQCSVVFVPEYGDQRRAYCSKQCAKRAARGHSYKTLNARARAKLRKFYGAEWRTHYESINKRLVFERDKWTCQICGHKVKRTKEYHPHQASVDHIVPLSEGGGHVYSNVQTACVMCNSVKGTDAIEECAGLGEASG